MGCFFTPRDRRNYGIHLTRTPRLARISMNLVFGYSVRRLGLLYQRRIQGTLERNA